jgi:hypothetical protein
VRAAVKQSPGVYRYSAIVVEKGAIVRDWRSIKRLRVI